ncbi:pancreatic secretory granule membrane major glycoprotein GP2 [Synchiropus picturatus]
MFINTIHNNQTDVITRNYINITFVCRYPVSYMVQPPSGENMIRVDVRTITLNTEDGNFSVAMLLFKDEAFQDRWTTVPSLSLDDDIFVKVFMIPAHLLLRVERCWATPSSDPYSNVQYTFIRDSCPVVRNQQTLSVLRNGQGPEAMFRIQMFKFVGSSYTNVFLHCNVQICHNAPGQCQPNCSSEEGLIRTRRDVPLSHTVSYGPIRRLLSDKANPNAGQLPAVETFVLGGLLVILLLITAVFGRLWVRSRRFYPAREAQLTLSNIHHLSEVAS